MRYSFDPPLVSVSRLPHTLDSSTSTKRQKRPFPLLRRLPKYAFSLSSPTFRNSFQSIPLSRQQHLFSDPMSSTSVPIFLSLITMLSPVPPMFLYVLWAVLRLCDQTRLWRGDDFPFRCMLLLHLWFLCPICTNVSRC